MDDKIPLLDEYLNPKLISSEVNVPNVGKDFSSSVYKLDAFNKASLNVNVPLDYGVKEVITNFLEAKQLEQNKRNIESGNEINVINRLSSILSGYKDLNKEPTLYSMNNNNAFKNAQLNEINKNIIEMNNKTIEEQDKIRGQIMNSIGEYVGNYYGISSDKALSIINDPGGVRLDVEESRIQHDLIHGKHKDPVLKQVQKMMASPIPISSIKPVITFKAEGPQERRLYSYINEYKTTVDDFINEEYRRRVANDTSTALQTLQLIPGIVTKTIGSIYNIGGQLGNVIYGGFQELNGKFLNSVGILDNESYNKYRENVLNARYKTFESINKQADEIGALFGIFDFVYPIYSTDTFSEYNSKDWFLQTADFISAFASGTLGIKVTAQAVNAVSAFIKKLPMVGRISGLGFDLMTGKASSDLFGRSIYEIGKKVSPKVFNELNPKLISNAMLMANIEYSAGVYGFQKSLYDRYKSLDKDNFFDDIDTANMIAKPFYIIGATLLNLNEAKDLLKPQDLLKGTAYRLDKDTIAKNVKKLEEQMKTNIIKESLKEGVEGALDPFSQFIGTYFGTIFNTKEDLEKEFSLNNLINVYLSSFLGEALGGLGSTGLSSLLRNNKNFIELQNKYPILGFIPVNSPYKYEITALELNKSILSSLEKVNFNDVDSFLETHEGLKKMVEELSPQEKDFVKEDVKQKMNSIENNAISSLKEGLSLILNGISSNVNPNNVKLVNDFLELFNIDSKNVNKKDLNEIFDYIDIMDSIDKRMLMNNPFYEDVINSSVFKLMDFVKRVDDIVLNNSDYQSLKEFYENYKKLSLYDEEGNSIYNTDTTKTMIKVFNNLMLKKYIENKYNTEFSNQEFKIFTKLLFDINEYNDLLQNNPDSDVNEIIFDLIANKVENNDLNAFYVLEQLNLLDVVENNSNEPNINTTIKDYKTNKEQYLKDNKIKDIGEKISFNLKDEDGNSFNIRLVTPIEAGIDLDYKVSNKELAKKFLKTYNFELEDNDFKDKKTLISAIKRNIKLNINNLLNNGIDNLNSFFSDYEYIIDEFINENDDTNLPKLDIVIFINKFISYFNNRPGLLTNIVEEINDNIMDNEKDEFKKYLKGDKEGLSSFIDQIITMNAYYKGGIPMVDTMYKDGSNYIPTIYQPDGSGKFTMKDGNEYTLDEIIVNVDGEEIKLSNILKEIIKDTMIFNEYNNGVATALLTDYVIKNNINGKTDVNFFFGAYMFSMIFYTYHMYYDMQMSNNSLINNFLSKSDSNLFDIKDIKQKGAKAISQGLRSSIVIFRSDNLQKLFNNLKRNVIMAMKSGIYKDSIEIMEKTIDIFRNRAIEILNEENISETDKQEIIMNIDKKIDEFRQEMNRMINLYNEIENEIFEISKDKLNTLEDLNNFIIDYINSLNLDEETSKNILLMLGQVLDRNGNLNNFLPNIIVSIMFDEIGKEELEKVSVNQNKDNEFILNYMKSIENIDKILDKNATEIASLMRDYFDKLTNIKNKFANDDIREQIDEMRFFHKRLYDVYKKYLDTNDNDVLLNTIHRKIFNLLQELNNGTITENEFLESLSNIVGEEDFSLFTDLFINILDVMEKIYNELNRNGWIDENEKKELRDIYNELEDHSEYFTFISNINIVNRNNKIQNKINNYQSNINNKMDTIRNMFGNKKNLIKNVIDNILDFIKNPTKEKGKISTRIIRKTKELLNSESSYSFNSDITISSLNLC